jgi:methionyl aminopeptidase
VSINDPEELEALRAAGAVVRRVLEAMKREVRPGVTTKQLDEVGSRVIEENGARSAPIMVPASDVKIQGRVIGVLRKY